VRPAAIAAALALVLVGACSSGGDGATPTTTTEATTTTVTFTGDPASPFCTNPALLGGVPDPFTDDRLPPGELESRFTDVETTFAAIAPTAPPELSDDIARVRRGLALLHAYLEKYGYDLQRAADEGTASERKVFNDRSYAASGSRISAYVLQVCGLAR
jgi:hypothetical protein